MARISSLTLLFTACVGSLLANKMPPHIIIIMGDDLGWDDVSFHGSAQIPTSNIDTLAADGIILNNHYVLPACTPSRAALLTGLYPIHTGMQQSVILNAEPWGLPPDVKIMPEIFKDIGYETHLVGKWHLGNFAKEYTPTFRGFDTFYGIYGGEVDYRSHTTTMYNKTGLDFWHDLEPIRNNTGTFSTTLLTGRATDLIKYRNKTKPFFLYFGGQAPHAGSDIPLDSPAENTAKFPYIGELNRTIYAGMVDTLDESVGDIVDALHTEGMLENSIVLFMSDNGAIPYGPHSNRGFNWPLRGAKGGLWEGATRVATFLWSPFIAKRRRVSNQMMHVTDWLPTLYHAAGGDAKRLEKHLDGKNMWPHLSLNRVSPRNEFLYNIEPAEEIAALRYKNYKLVLGVHYGGLFDGRYKTTGGSRPYSDLDALMTKSKVANVLRALYNASTIKFPPKWRKQATLSCGRNGDDQSNFVVGKPPYLFDLAKDPCELTNLASTKRKVVAALRKRLDRYYASALPSRNQPVDPRGYPENLNGTWGVWI